MNFTEFQYCTDCTLQWHQYPYIYIYPLKSPFQEPLVPSTNTLKATFDGLPVDNRGCWWISTSVVRLLCWILLVYCDDQENIRTNKGARVSKCLKLKSETHKSYGVYHEVPHWREEKWQLTWWLIPLNSGSVHPVDRHWVPVPDHFGVRALGKSLATTRSIWGRAGWSSPLLIGDPW